MAYSIIMTKKMLNIMKDTQQLQQDAPQIITFIYAINKVRISFTHHSETNNQNVIKYMN